MVAPGKAGTGLSGEEWMCMGEKMIKFFEEAERLGGLQGKVRLAMLSLTPSQQARIIPDTPENLRKLQGAIDQLKSELQQQK